ncbi:quinone-dependent dihydroorotate dehydrogenase [Aestuariicella hydrocarbonica]|uniref:Dihydroorotate dehydrogenase (quinone) n=1 Tax=Pseudomaricurvus hydrocarbonicus TaxID=1470433 RepID=A0A9E5JWZ7_9GAMM|nr:quinone-dependent dihydroorotate dehydrogenase [Aestuariicella hydrocarbonica]NHO66460.1 quinone-dependent dihydroorotate dehydrogenase [Aestuariicella hydrocarbonica]
MYDLARKLMFRLDPETAHELTIDMLGAGERLGLIRPFIKPVPNNPVEVMGITFPNPVGLAAGLDKNGDCFNALGQLGFGFVEIGTITPRPQPGNPRPRLFRLPEFQGIINRMGFNNKGVEHLVEQVKRRRFSGVLGINIGKNFDTPVEKAADDYRLCMQAVYEYADYITVNISSPNTPGLRDLQFGDSLKSLLSEVKKEQLGLESLHGRYVPIAVKIAPDMDTVAIQQVAEVLLASGLDGVIATNTTISRDGVEASPVAQEAGGLSGKPVRAKSTEVIRTLAEALEGKLPIIGVGGILSGRDAAEKIEAGASLVQIYSGFIYRGPELISESARAIAALQRQTST